MSTEPTLDELMARAATDPEVAKAIRDAVRQVDATREAAAVWNRIVAAWTGRPFEFDGKTYHISDVASLTQRHDGPPIVSAWSGDLARDYWVERLEFVAEWPGGVPDLGNPGAATLMPHHIQTVQVTGESLR